ncbi:MAG: acetate--CoA ligase [Magnetococcales bacterium]|nr:acetate--CoA ligase [Magnetococcales bacterium]
MSHSKVYPVPKHVQKTAYLNNDDYLRMYARSMENPDAFWGEMAEELLVWHKKWDTVKNCNFTEPRIEWFKGGKLNVAYNCLDRHLEDKGDKIALIWEKDSPEEDSETYTYKQLHEQVCKFANVLKAQGVKKADTVCIYMPMIPQATIAMLACARLGAVHNVVFAGFSAEALASRVESAKCKVVVTSNESVRGGKHHPLKDIVDDALENHRVSCVDKVIVYKRTDTDVNMVPERDLDYKTEMAKASADCGVEYVDATDPLFILYTSGSTGKPKGAVHGSGGYLLYATATFKYVFDYKHDDVYWCTADVGWITGHSYIAYGPLSCGATQVIFEGVPQYPTWSRFWQVADKHKVSILYTSPTAIRAIQSQGDEFVHKTKRESLRILGSVGEPINPEAWAWYHEVIGREKCQIVDTWWQTETGGHMLTPLPGATDLKPGSATRPFFGVSPKLVDEQGVEIEGAGSGILCIDQSWPGQMITVYGDHDRFKEAYFSTFKNLYFTGDGCTRDEDDYYWITGRVDDIINVSGHRIGTAEVESALVLHEAVSEAAVVGYPHPIKGEGIYAYVTLHSGFTESEDLRKELLGLCVSEISAIAKPDVIHWSKGLPKTRSGKIMRRILRKISSKDTDNLGDISTLAEPEVVETLIHEREQFD